MWPSYITNPSYRALWPRSEWSKIKAAADLRHFKKYFQIFYFFHIAKIYCRLLLRTSINSHCSLINLIILSSKEITFRFVGDELRKDIQNIMQVAPLLRWSPKLKYLFASDWETAKSLASFLEQLLSKATIGPSSKILFIRYLEGLFSLQNTLCLERSKCLFFCFS